MKLLALLSLAGLSVVGLIYYTSGWSWNQQLTVSVMTPSGMKVASSVQRGAIYRYLTPGFSLGAARWLSGEAVVLEVAPGRYLVGLLRDTPHAWSVMLPDETNFKVAGRWLVASRETRKLNADQYPLFVTFKGNEDPATMVQVDPNRFDEVFGDGYQLASVEMTLTDEPLTSGKIRAIFEWLNWP